MEKKDMAYARHPERQHVDAAICEVPFGKPL